MGLPGLAAALARAQGEMGHAIKDSTNPHFKNRYASLAACWDACRGPLTKHGLSVVQMLDRSDSGTVLRTIILHASGESIESSYPIQPGEKATPQAWGSAITYARRYALCAAVGLAPDDDDDGEQASRVSHRDEPRKPTNGSSLTKMREELALILLNPKCPRAVVEGCADYDTASPDRLAKLLDRARAKLAEVSQ